MVHLCDVASAKVTLIGNVEVSLIVSFFRILIRRHHVITADDEFTLLSKRCRESAMTITDERKRTTERLAHGIRTLGERNVDTFTSDRHLFTHTIRRYYRHVPKSLQLFCVGMAERRRARAYETKSMRWLCATSHSLTVLQYCQMNRRYC